MFYVKLHEISGEILVAVCDRELLGKTLSEGELEFHVKESFYRGEIKNMEELKRLLKEATIANLIGNKAVETALSLGHVSPEHILTIDGVKHAQYAVMED